MSKISIFSKEYQEIITRDDPTRTRAQLLQELNPATCLDCGYTRDEPTTNYEALCKACKPNAIVEADVLPIDFDPPPPKPWTLPLKTDDETTK